MSYSLSIGPVSHNPEAALKLAFGKNVSATRVMSFVEQNAHQKEKCGLITNQEAAEIVRETEERLKSIHLV